MSNWAPENINPEKLKAMGTERIEPENYVYAPPKGAPLLEAPKNGLFYKPDEPSASTDRLLPYERRYINPIAIDTAGVFGLYGPVPDDIYRAVPEYSKLKNMFCIISRSGVKKLDNGIFWEPVVVIVRKFLIVRIQCFLAPSSGTFNVKRILMWSKMTQNYEAAEDPATGTVNPSVIPYLLTKYNEIEGVTG